MAEGVSVYILELRFNINILRIRRGLTHKRTRELASDFSDQERTSAVAIL